MPGRTTLGRIVHDLRSFRGHGRSRGSSGGTADRRRRIGIEPLESRRLLAVSAVLDKGVLRINSGADNDQVVLTTYPTAYAVQGTGLGAVSFAKAAVTSIRVTDVAGGAKVAHVGQSLLIGRVGNAAVTHGLTVEGIESTVLNANIATTTAAVVSFKGPVLLPTGGAIAISLGAASKLGFESTLNGAASLEINAPGSLVSLSGRVGNVSPLSALAFTRAGAVTASASVAVDGGGKTVNGITFGRDVGGVLMNGAGSSVTRCTGAGIRIAASPLASGWTRTVSGFTVTRCGVGVDFGYAADQAAGQTGFHNWTISNGTVSGNTTHGVRLGADSAGRSWTTALVIAGNTVSGNANDGIRVEGTPEGLAIQANTVTDNGRGARDAAVRVVNGLGVQRKSVLIWNNAISGADASKLSVATGIAATNMPGLRIVGNKVTSISRGIRLTGGFKRLDTAAVLSANVIDNVDAGISLASAKAVTADAGNFVTRARQVGLQASGDCSGSVLKGVSIVATESTTADGRTGLSLDAATGVDFEGLSIKGGYFGVYARGNAAKTRIINGTVEKSVVGVFLDGAGPSSSDSYGVKSLKLLGPKVIDCTTGLHAQGDCAGTLASMQVQQGQYGISLKQATGLQVETVVFKSVTGIRVEGACANTVLQGYWVSGCTTGMSLESATGVTIKNYSFNSNTFGLIAYGQNSGTLFDGCTFKGNVQGVTLVGAAGLKFVGGNVADNEGFGLRAEGVCSGTEITGTAFIGNGKGGNWVRTNRDSGIVLSAAKGLVFAGGIKSESNGVHGLYAEGDCTGTKLSDGSFAANGGAGVSLVGARGLFISANSVTGNTGNGITVVGDATATTISGNTVSDNKQNGFVFAATLGLMVNGANKFTGNGGNGVYGTGLCTGTAISGNNTISTNAYGGLVLVDAKAVSVTKNTISGNKSFGLFATGVCTGTTATGNTITGNNPNVSVNATGGTFQKA